MEVGLLGCHGAVRRSDLAGAAFWSDADPESKIEREKICRPLAFGRPGIILEAKFGVNTVPMKTPKLNQTLVWSMTCIVVALLCGCERKPDAQPVYENTKSSAKEAGQAIGDAAKKTGVAVGDAAKDTGKVVGDAAEKTWDGIKKGAQEVSNTATNVAGEVKAGAQTVGEKVKGVFK
jgi:hypothetical protein